MKLKAWPHDSDQSVQSLILVLVNCVLAQFILRRSSSSISSLFGQNFVENGCNHVSRLVLLSRRYYRLRNIMKNISLLRRWTSKPREMCNLLADYPQKRKKERKTSAAHFQLKDFSSNQKRLVADAKCFQCSKTLSTVGNLIASFNKASEPCFRARNTRVLLANLTLKKTTPTYFCCLSFLLPPDNLH